MRMIALVGAAALLATLTAANAAEVTGRIKYIDDADHRVVLTNGQSYNFGNEAGPPAVTGFEEGFHPGQKVIIQHNGGVATAITPAG